MLWDNLNGELLQVQVGVHIVIHSLANDVGALQPVFLSPFTIELILGLPSFLLVHQ